MLDGRGGGHPVPGPAVAVRGLVKRYGARTVLDGLDLRVQRGSTLAVLGPNGSGKTTLVEVLLGLRAPDGGEVAVLGLDPRRQGRELHRRVGAQLQSATLPSRLEVGEALRWFAALHHGPADPTELLATWGLADHARTAVDDLSGGLRQRLFLALALVNRPELVVLDELTTGLDPVARRATWASLSRLRASGTTVLLVTHDLVEAQSTCERAVVLHRGRVALDAPVPELVARHGSLEEAYLSVVLPEVAA